MPLDDRKFGRADTVARLNAQARDWHVGVIVLELYPDAVVVDVAVALVALVLVAVLGLLAQYWIPSVRTSHRSDTIKHSEGVN